MKNKKEVLFKLFISTLYLSAFTFGGGYVIVTLMKKKFVDELQWIEDDDMLDLGAIPQSAPGPTAVSGAIVEGYKELHAVQPTWKTLVPEHMADNLALPLHPGAEKYYREAGIIK